MDAAATLKPVSWQRMAEGIEQVRDRLERAAKALSGQGVRYAVVGGNAAWPERFPEELAGRLRMILDDPEG